MLVLGKYEQTVDKKLRTDIVASAVRVHTKRLETQYVQVFFTHVHPLQAVYSCRTVKILYELPKLFQDMKVQNSMY